jgi:hypothetical protein
MIQRRHLTPPGHATIEFFIGMLALVAPLALGFGIAGAIASVTAGALLIGVSISLTGRRSAPILPHRNFDTLFASAVAGTALLLALAGDAPATIFFASLAVVHVALSALTRYVGTI